MKDANTTLLFLILLSFFLTLITVVSFVCDFYARKINAMKGTAKPEGIFPLISTLITIISIIVTLVVFFLGGDGGGGGEPTPVPVVENTSTQYKTPMVAPPTPTLTPSETVKPPKTPMPTRPPLIRAVNISAVPIVDMSDQGFDTGLGTDHFSIQPSQRDNFGNTYDLAGIFSWQREYAVSGYVVFYIADYSKLAGQLVAIQGKRPSEDAYVVMYLDDIEVARFTGIEKTTLPTDLELDLTDCSLLRIETNCQEIMYVNFKFYVETN